MVIDDLREIIAVVSTLETMAGSLDSSSVDEQFGWGLFLLLDHIRKDLQAVETKLSQKEESGNV